MAEAHHVVERQKSAQGLRWPLGQPLSFYSVEGDDSGGRVRFVRDFHRAMELATLAQRYHGGIWIVAEWEWDAERDEDTFVRVAGQARPVTARRPTNG